ncbi:MAG: S8 family serine peptidase [Gemmatimonadota bacterium]
MPSPRKTTAKRSSGPKKAKLPKLVYAQASPLSIGGSSLFDVSGIVSADSVEAYTSEESVRRNAITALQAAGFQVLDDSACTINICAPPKLYEEVFGTKLLTDERPVIKEMGREDTATFIDTADTDVSGFVDTSKSRLANAIEGIAIEEPIYFFAASPFAPTKGYWHLRVPGDVSAALSADRAHRFGITGRGVRVIMTDSGWFRHPYFTARGYRSAPVVLGPGAANPNADESGHGTGESANLFAVAPDISFTMVKLSFVNATGGFNAAVRLNPHIISNSWGSSIRRGPLSPARQALAAAIAFAVRRGITVVFSAGNGHFGFPAQHPEVIAAGGVYVEPDGSMRASDYASGFASLIYPGRNVPDVSGLVGMRSPDQPVSPGAMYIMLPVEPSDDIDVGLHNGGRPHYRSPGAASPFGDETARNDGWAVFSGTSAAAPQIAGACALLKQAAPRLTPAAIKAILMRTARDVTVGACSPHTGANPAGPGPDLATGHGLVNAFRAALIAIFRRRLSRRGVLLGTPEEAPTELPLAELVETELAGTATGELSPQLAASDLAQEYTTAFEAMIASGDIESL